MGPTFSSHVMCFCFFHGISVGKSRAEQTPSKLSEAPFFDGAIAKPELTVSTVIGLDLDLGLLGV
jgi:hypothetical protein